MTAAPDPFDAPDGRTCEPPIAATPGQTAIPPGQAAPADVAVIAAYGAWLGVTSGEAAEAWQVLSGTPRASWHRVVKAVTQATFGAPPQPAPGEPNPWRLLASLAAVLFEGDEPAELRASRAIEILEANGVTFHDAFAKGQEPQPAPADDADRLRKALENVFAVLDRQTRTYAERISYARTLIRTALEGK